MATPLAFDRRINVLWVCPVFQSVYARPFGQFLGMALNAASSIGDKYCIFPFVPEREMLHSAMNRAVQVLLKGDYQAMIVSDDDCFPPFDAIRRLLKHHEDGKDVVAALGFMRGYPHTTTVGRYYKEGVSLKLDTEGRPSLTGFYWVDDVSNEPDLIPCDFAGMPIAMISRRAFEKIPGPWFGTEIDGGGCTHDVYFGHKAAKAGVKILVDKTMPCGHLCDPHIITNENRAIVRGVAAKWDEALKAETEQAAADADVRLAVNL